MTTRPRTTLVLFDIDGTLIQSGRAGVRGMNRAFGRLHGRTDALDTTLFAGRTDLAIVTEAMRRCAIDPTSDAILRLRDAYFEDLAVELARPVDAPVGILPGVVALLDALSGRPDVVVALLTGNFVGGARIKLGHFGLWDRFPFGAFGDAHLDRRPLVPIAIAEARAAGISVDRPDDVVVIGDTPLDVDCAQAYGARSVAVATGNYDRAALEATGADVVVQTLDAAAVHAAILGRG